MNKSRSSYKWISFAAASLLAAALVGCGSSGGGGGDSGATTPPPATGGTTPSGTAVLTAAAANPAATNTAANPNQAFGLIVDVGASPVVIQSPPVVTFAVIDSAGKHVPGLKLVNTAGAGDTACSTSATYTGGNVTFAIAKLNQPTDTSPSTWQSLISRQRLAANTATQFAVVEGTTDPKPTATLTNPATAVSDSSTRVVGILEENAAGGYYTYRFAMDVLTPLLMANAVAGRNFASTSTAVNKIANNGNLAVKDGKTIHRVGMQLCYTDTASKAKVVVNPYIDFTLGADGVAVPVKASDGKTLAAYRKVVDKASCNECHAPLTAHGTRVEPNYCVICHNPGSTDYNTNNPIDLKLMIHKFHMGANNFQAGVHLSKDYTVAEFTARATNPTTGAVTGSWYPQAQQNCVKCHDNKVAAQADNWKNVPSRNACGACHDGIDFAKNTGVTLADAAKGLKSSSPAHIGGAKQDDTQCVLCHDSTTIPVYHSDTMPSTADATKRTMSATISKVAVGAADGSVTVTFTLSDKGVAVTDPAAFKNMALSLAKLRPAKDGASTNWMSYTGRARTKDAAQPPVIQGYSELAAGQTATATRPAMPAGTLTHVGSGVWTYKFALMNASTPGDIRTVDHVHNVSSVAGAYNFATVPTYPNVVAYEPSLTHRVGMEFQTAAGVDNTTNAYFDFVPDGNTTAATRNIVTMTNCATCHGGRKIHKGYATEYCVTCHNQNTYEPFSGNSPVTVDYQRVIHKVHFNGTDYVINDESFGSGSKTGYPGNIKDCAAACHKETATKADGKTLLENAANWRTTPTKRACGTCHDTTAALDHIDSQITAKGEQCVFCHGPTTTFGLDVKSVHSK